MHVWALAAKLRTPSASLFGIVFLRTMTFGKIRIATKREWCIVLLLKKYNYTLILYYT